MAVDNVALAGSADVFDVSNVRTKNARDRIEDCCKRW